MQKIIELPKFGKRKTHKSKSDCVKSLDDFKFKSPTLDHFWKSVFSWGHPWIEQNNWGYVLINTMEWKINKLICSVSIKNINANNNVE